MESKIPCRKPGIFPGIRHNDDVSTIEVSPGSIASTLRRWSRFGRVTSQPFLDIVHIELLAPEQASKCLALYSPCVVVLITTQGIVKGISFFHTYVEKLSSIIKRRIFFI